MKQINFKMLISCLVASILLAGCNGMGMGGMFGQQDRQDTQRAQLDRDIHGQRAQMDRDEIGQGHYDQPRGAISRHGPTAQRGDRIGQDRMVEQPRDMRRGQFAPDARHDHRFDEPRAGVGETNPRARGQEDERARVDVPAVQEDQLIAQATEVYRRVIQGPQGEVPREVLAEARCVTVFPEVTTAALVVGGTVGNGVASCRQNGEWSQPAFLNMAGGSLGAQIGARNSDIVLFMITDEAEQNLKDGRFTLGVDTSVTAGEFDAQWQSPQAGVVAYQMTEGAFIGASLHGINVNKDEERIRQFYGRDLELAAILEGQQPEEARPEARQFTDILPQRG